MSLFPVSVHERFYLSLDKPHREMINPAKLVKIPHIFGHFAMTFKAASLVF